MDTTTKGMAYVFLRKDGAILPSGPAGHVGWGVHMIDGPKWFCGATENSSGGLIVPPGQNTDGWYKEVASEAEMLDLFRVRLYDAYKVASVRSPRPAAARVIGEKAPTFGYTGLFNNCLDHTFKVLGAYGDLGMPWPQTNPVPSHWFGAYLGEYRNL